MPADYLAPTDIQKFAPDGGVAVTLNYPGVAWAWSAWQELTPAVGSAGAEEVVSTIKEYGSPNVGESQNGSLLPVLIDAFPGGARVPPCPRGHRERRLVRARGAVALHGLLASAGREHDPGGVRGSEQGAAALSGDAYGE